MGDFFFAGAGVIGTGDVLVPGGGRPDNGVEGDELTGASVAVAAVVTVGDPTGVDALDSLMGSNQYNLRSRRAVYSKTKFSQSVCVSIQIREYTPSC